MASITLRNIPENLLEEIKQAAVMERRSISAEILYLIRIGIQTILRQHDHLQAVENMRRCLADRPRFPVNVTALIDEDRQ